MYIYTSSLVVEENRTNRKKMKILFVSLLLGFAQSAEWTYENNGAAKWEQDYEACRGSRQSPIDIPYDLEHKVFDDFVMTGYDNMATSDLVLINNGHTAQININSASYGNTKVSGGGLNGTYIAVQLHFHWGQNDDEGSEHLFRGRKYPLELHIVHYKESYGSLASAVAEPDGLAVLGFFFTTDGAEENMNLTPLIDSLDSIKYKDSNKTIRIDFSALMPKKKTEFYRYMGSLTTPGCNEVVVWTVFENKNTISSAQLAKFRSLYETKRSEPFKSIRFNYRPPQDLFKRTVYKNYAGDVAESWHWGYEGMEGARYWQDYYRTCKGERQSPINIPHWKQGNQVVAKYMQNLDLESLEFRNYDTPIDGTIKNNGHTIQVDLHDSDAYITKGNLPGNYKAAQFHFHWGHDSTEGSEHTLEGKAYPLELHIVHYKEDYGSLGGALGYEDGLAVVGFFFESGSAFTNKNYGKIVSKLSSVKYKDSSNNIDGFSLKDITYENRLRLNASFGYALPYYRYTGGLTTPPCLQIVTWSVMRNPILITEEQIAAFREVSHITNGTIGSHDKIKLNFRPVQELFDREVYVSEDLQEVYNTDATSGLLPNILCMAAILITASLL